MLLVLLLGRWGQWWGRSRLVEVGQVEEVVVVERAYGNVFPFLSFHCYGEDLDQCRSWAQTYNCLSQSLSQM